MFDEMLDRKKISLRRKHRISFLLNEEESKALRKFCDDYGVKNKSQFIRESLFSKVINKFEMDYPTLFDETVMDGMIVKRNSK